MSNQIATPTNLPTILWRQDSLTDTNVVYYFNGKLLELNITNADLTYLEYGEMCESYSDYTQKSTYTWELWSTTDRLTDKQLAELIQGEKYLQNKSAKETASSFAMYATKEQYQKYVSLKPRKLARYRYIDRTKGGIVYTTIGRNKVEALAEFRKVMPAASISNVQFMYRTNETR